MHFCPFIAIFSRRLGHFRPWRHVFFLAWLYLSTLGFGLTPVAHAASGNASPISPEAGIQRAIAQRVLALIGYTRWPVAHDAYRICIVGNRQHTALLQEQGIEGQGGYRLLFRLYPEFEPPSDDCEVLYLGSMSRERGESILKLWQGKAVLTIGEEEDCSGSLMFCLAVKGDNVGMLLNLDAVSRAGVKVNANVLKLFGRKKGGE